MSRHHILASAVNSSAGLAGQFSAIDIHAELLLVTAPSFKFNSQPSSYQVAITTIYHNDAARTL